MTHASEAHRWADQLDELCTRIASRFSHIEQRWRARAGIYVGGGCVCASDILAPAADGADATPTSAPLPQAMAAAPTPDAKAGGAPPVR